jgi:hypothetical protein
MFVLVNPVALAIDNTVPLPVKTILNALAKLIERVFVLLETKLPV